MIKKYSALDGKLSFSDCLLMIWHWEKYLQKVEINCNPFVFWRWCECERI